MHSIHHKATEFGNNLISAGTVAPSFPTKSHHSSLHPAGSITLVMYISLYFLEVEQGLSMRTQWVLGFILLALICGTCLWFLFNIFRRKEVLVALFKSTTVKAGRGLAQIRTLVKSDRLRSMITRSTDRSTSNATLRSNPTMESTTEEG